MTQILEMSRPKVRFFAIDPQSSIFLQTFQSPVQGGAADTQIFRQLALAEGQADAIGPKREAMALVAGRDKIVLIVTHDPLLALSADMRIVMEDGVMRCCLKRTQRESELYGQLVRLNDGLEQLRKSLREGRTLTGEEWEHAVQRILE